MDPMVQPVGSSPRIRGDWLTHKLLIAALICSVCLFALIQPSLGLAAAAMFAAAASLQRHMATALLVLSFLIPFDVQFRLASGSPAYLDLAFAVVAVPLARDLVLHEVRPNWYSFALAPFLLFAVSSTYFRTENQFWLLVSALRWAIAIFFMAAIATYAAGEKIVLVIGSTLVPLVLYGLYQLAIGDFGPLFGIMSGSSLTLTDDKPWMDRAYSVFAHPNTFGSFCAVVVVMLLALATRSQGRRVAVTATLAATGLIGLLASGSRGAWIGAAAGTAVVLVFSRVNVFRLVLVMLIVTMSVALASMIDVLPLFRAEQVEEFIKQTRLELWGAAILMFLRSPIVGVGWMRFPDLMPSVINWDYGEVHAHNMYLQFLAETGLVGFILFFVPLIYLLIRNLRRSRTVTTALVASAGIVTLLVHGLFEMMLYSPQNLLLFAALLGLAAQAAFVQPRTSLKEVASAAQGTPH